MRFWFDPLANLSPGSVILNCEPFAHVVNGNVVDTICDACLKQSNSPLLKCASCKLVRYCNRRCQKAGWSDHKDECKYLTQLRPHAPTETVRLIARIVLKLRKGGAKEQGELPDGAKRTFFDLKPHRTEILKDQQRMRAFEGFYMVLEKYFADEVPPKDEIFEIFCRISINSFNIMDDEYQSIGVGLYLEGSVFDHSCEPNACIVFHGKKLEVRFIGPEPLPGPVECSQDLRISYTCLLNDTPTRQKELRDLYYFDCRCSKCEVDPGTLDILKRGCTRCPHCVAPVPVPKEIPTKSLKCATCSTDLGAERLQDFSRSKRILDSILQSKSKGDAPISDSRLALIHNVEKVVHFNDLSLLRALELANDVELQKKDFRNVLKTSLSLLKAYTIYYPRYSANMGLIHLRIAKVADHLGHINFASQHLRKAEEHLFVTYGPDHGLYQSVLVPFMKGIEQDLEASGAR